MTSQGISYPTEEQAKQAACKDLAPYLVKLPDDEGFAWFSAGEHSPRGSWVLAHWGWVKTEVKGPDGRRRHEEQGRKGWKDVRFGQSKPGLR